MYICNFCNRYHSYVLYLDTDNHVYTLTDTDISIHMDTDIDTHTSAICV